MIKVNFLRNIMKLDLLFKILAVVFVAVAAYFLWQGNRDSLFVSAVLAAVSFFLSIRFKFAETKKQRQAAYQSDNENDEDENQ